MAADLQPVVAVAQMVGVVDHPGREPQHLALELGEEGKTLVHAAHVTRRKPPLSR